MAAFTIAHISDLHFSQGADETTPHRHSIPHLKLIQQTLNNEPIDKLIVSGDLTNMGDKESLLRVRDWLFGEFSISADEKLGLNLRTNLVSVVPGNHDAYNAKRSPGGYQECWQKSIANYREIFPHPQTISGCTFDWLEKDGRGIYIAYVDSCFLGDPELQHLKGFRNALIHQVGKVARGKLSISQSNQLVAWFDLGMTGELINPNNETSKIPKGKFAQSFKILVMQHYLFEPEGFKDDFFLKIQHRDTVFRNIALADFDMYLCGHKHVSDFSHYLYGQHFDRWAKGRYLMNLFRRRLGANTLPYQFKDSEGKMTSSWLSRFLEIAILKQRSEQVDETTFIESLMDVIRNCVTNPAKFGADLENFVRTHELSGQPFLDADEIQEIHTRICSQLSKKEREVLTQTGLIYISRMVKKMNARPFIHSMCGSSAKASNSSQTLRNFNIYKFEISNQLCRVTRTRFDLQLPKVSKATDHFEFANHHQVALRQA